MTRKLGKEYFKNKSEQARIEGLLLGVIPSHVKYYNLVIVLAKMLADFSRMAFKEEVYNEPVDDLRDK